MNFEEFKEKCEELELDVEMLANHDYPDGYEEIFGPIETMEDIGGGEGDGEERYVVLYIKNSDLYIRMDGWYMSQDGSHFEEDFYQVWPVEKMVTFYEAPEGE